MSTEYKPPLALHFIWHPSDNKSIECILDSVRNNFARCTDRPFSRGLNIPLFYYSTPCPNSPPKHEPLQKANKDIVFVFTSVNTLGCLEWCKYIDNFKFLKSMDVVPIAVDKYGLGHSQQKSRLGNLNFIRFTDWNPDTLAEYAILSMLHEIYRYGFNVGNTKDTSKSSSVKIFLSHAKHDDIGKCHADTIRKFINDTNMRSFFDATDISPGCVFFQDIKKHIEKSTVLVLSSDTYSSRYWCQREIIYAKMEGRPILAVNCLAEYEDRIFPASTNVPCVRISSKKSLNNHDTLRILITAMLETIRYKHVTLQLKNYQKHGWINSDCDLHARPPEMFHASDLGNKPKTQNGKLKICYPEPPLYPEELKLLNNVGIDAFTPLLGNSDSGILRDWRVGISISNVSVASVTDFSQHHLHQDYTERFAQDIARYLLAREATLIYGGDLRENGFTQFILDEAVALMNRNPNHANKIYVENHLAWPIYVPDNALRAWRAKYSSVMYTREHDIPEDISACVDKNIFIKPCNFENKYIWSRCLTEMRQESINCSDARICAGGKLFGYNGKMPGVLEEIMIAIETKKPTYLLGAFGGVVGEVCKTIRKGEATKFLTEDWQVCNNAGYKDLQEKAREDNYHANYEHVKLILENPELLSDMIQRSGLTENKYMRLMESPFIDECVYLIIQGLKALPRNRK